MNQVITFYWNLYHFCKLYIYFYLGFFFLAVILMLESQPKKNQNKHGDMYKISDIYMQKRNSSKRQPALTSSYFLCLFENSS